MKDFYLLTYLQRRRICFLSSLICRNTTNVTFLQVFFVFEDKLLMVLSYIQIKYFRMTSVSKIRKMKMWIT